MEENKVLGAEPLSLKFEDFLRVCDHLSKDANIVSSAKAIIELIKEKTQSINFFLEEEYSRMPDIMRPQILENCEEIKRLLIGFTDIRTNYPIFQEGIKKAITLAVDKLIQQLKSDASQEKKTDPSALYERQQFFVSHQEASELLHVTLERVRSLFPLDKQRITCFISYAWPYDYTTNPMQVFLKRLHTHLALAGLSPILDIVDCRAGESINTFEDKIHNSEYVILVGTPTLKEKSDSPLIKNIQIELNLIRQKYDADVLTKGRRAIIPILLEGTLRSSFPAWYEGHTNVIESSDYQYEKLLEHLLRLFYVKKQKNEMFDSIWLDFYKEIESMELIEDRVRVDQHEINYLTQSLGFSAAQIFRIAPKIEEHVEISPNVPYPSWRFFKGSSSSDDDAEPFLSPDQDEELRKNELWKTIFKVFDTYGECIYRTFDEEGNETTCEEHKEAISKIKECAIGLAELGALSKISKRSYQTSHTASLVWKAAERNWFDIVQLLVEEYGENPEEKGETADSNYKEPPLSAAIYNAQLETIRYLLSIHCDPRENDALSLAESWATYYYKNGTPYFYRRLEIAAREIRKMENRCEQQETILNECIESIKALMNQDIFQIDKKKMRGKINLFKVLILNQPYPRIILKYCLRVLEKYHHSNRVERNVLQSLMLVSMGNLIEVYASNLDPYILSCVYKACIESLSNKDLEETAKETLALFFESVSDLSLSICIKKRPVSFNCRDKAYIDKLIESHAFHGEILSYKN